MLKALCLAVATLMGAAAVANGWFMLVSPGDWYQAVPGVTTTGPFNQHFVRDIGLIYLLAGIAFLWGAAEPRYRVLLWALPTVWITSHALFHLWEVAAGVSRHSAMPVIFPQSRSPRSSVPH